MKFKVLPRQNPSDRTAQVRYYPFPQWDSELTMRQMAQQIAAHCTLTPPDITAVLEAFLYDLPHYLQQGHSIRLGDFGIIKMSFRGNGQPTADEVGAKDIHTPRVLFLAGTELKKQLAQTEYERADRM